jgi:sugar/nucleoside kinase (ribokinase family)
MDVVCIGAAGVDLFSPSLDRLPASGEAIFVDDLPLFVGGAAANTAIGLAKLGIKVGLISRLGCDLFGEYIAQYVSGYGVDVSRVTRSRLLGSSKSIALPVKGEDRRTIHCLGANVEFGLADIDVDYVKSARVVFLGGIGEGLDLETLSIVLRSCSNRSALKILNLTLAVEVTGISLASLRTLIADSDAIIFSRDEGAALTGSTSLYTQVDMIMSNGSKLLVITDGANGTLVSNRDGSFRIGAYSVDSLDQTGAGDAFNAGFIAAALGGKGLIEQLTWASAMGASVTTRLGCHDGLLTRKELMDFISSHKIGENHMDT